VNLAVLQALPATYFLYVLCITTVFVVAYFYGCVQINEDDDDDDDDEKEEENMP